MEIITDLKRILWHEFGHFCIDILDSKANPKFRIDSFRVSYHKNAISDHKWGGGVTTLPSLKFDVLVEDIDKTSFGILNFISGCVFQTIFIKEILKAQGDFKDCYCMQGKCAGQNDYFSIDQILSQIRKKYGRNPDFIFFFNELPYVFYKVIIQNQKFLDSINELINKYSDKIFEEYLQAENKAEFCYYFKTDDLEALKIEVYTTLLKTSFINTIITHKEMIKKNMISQR